jgi:hypothetical protein
MGGLRHTSAQIQELEATQSWIRASGEALAYLIRQSPAPKDAREKQVRARILLALRNALRATKKVRPSLAAPPELLAAPVSTRQQVNTSTGAPVNISTSKPVNTSAADGPADSPPAGPTPLRVDIVVPVGVVPDVRPGTTAGDPFTLEPRATGTLPPEAD